MTDKNLRKRYVTPLLFFHNLNYYYFVVQIDSKVSGACNTEACYVKLFMNVSSPPNNHSSKSPPPCPETDSGPFYPSFTTKRGGYLYIATFVGVKSRPRHPSMDAHLYYAANTLCSLLKKKETNDICLSFGFSCLSVLGMSTL